MYVGELLTQPVVTCHVNDTLATAAQRMWDRDIGALPVIHEDGTLAGMITDRDICMATFTQARAPDALLVNVAMSKQVVSAHADLHVSEIEHLMAEHQVHRIPVVDHDNRPIGVITLNDLAREAAKPACHLRNGPSRVAYVLASIGSSHHETRKAAA